MPLYEYRCTVCEERFEIEQSIKEDSLTSLPGDDHEHQLKKVFSPVGISFKGQGFYKNDARPSKKSSSSNSDSGSSSTSDSSSGSSGSESTSSTSKSDTSSKNSSSTSGSGSSGSGSSSS